MMNERIKELAEKAASEFTQTFYWEYVPQIDKDIFEKFAELIVRECVDKIETYRIPVGNSAAGELACEWTYDALEKIRDDIKEHFGVEL